MSTQSRADIFSIEPYQLQGGGGGGPTGPAAGDLSGNYPAPLVVGFYGRPLLSTAPTTGQSYVWNGTNWVPGTPAAGSPTGAAGGDLSGTYPNPTVSKLQNRPVSATAPTTNQVLTWNGTSWIPQNPAGLPLQFGLTYTTMPTLDGQLYSYTANNTVDLSKSDTVTKAVAFAGVWSAAQSGLQTIRGYPIMVRFASGLTLVGGKLFYISDTLDGLATNDPTSIAIGHFAKPVGSIIDASMYSAGDPTGSTALCILDPQPMDIVS